jgi:hypothetical protein
MVTQTHGQVWDVGKFTCSAQQSATGQGREGWHDRAVPLPAPVPVAAPDALTGLLCGPGRRALVRGVFPTAVYVDTGAEVVALVTSDALRLPCALVLAASSGSRPFATIRSGDAAGVGEGVVAVGDRQFLVRRWWRPAPLRPLHPGLRLAARADALEAVLPPLPPGLPADRRTWRPRALVGLGPGLTPAGDDILAAMLVTPSATPGAATAVAALVAETARLLTRTTALSATLLRHAAAGRAIPEVTRLVDALGDAGDLAAPTARLVSVGHSSGTALAHGVLAATRQALARAERPDTRVA